MRASAGPVDEADARSVGPVPDPPVSRAGTAPAACGPAHHTGKAIFDNFRNVVTQRMTET